jgi:hypothetical protein
LTMLANPYIKSNSSFEKKREFLKDCLLV